MFDIGSLVESFFSALGGILGQIPVVGEALSGIVGQVATQIAALLAAFGLGG
jgi:hypothetical protein